MGKLSRISWKEKKLTGIYDLCFCLLRSQLNLYDESVFSIVDARDKWLRPGGLIFPDSCTMNIAAIDDMRYYNSIFNFWMNVYDFKMHSIQRDMLTEPFQTRIIPKQVICAVFSMQYGLDEPSGQMAQWTCTQGCCPTVNWNNALTIKLILCFIPHSDCLATLQIENNRFPYGDQRQPPNIRIRFPFAHTAHDHAIGAVHLFRH